MSVAELMAPPEMGTLHRSPAECVWIPCTLPFHEEIRIEVRVDLTNGERRRLIDRNRELVAQSVAIQQRANERLKDLQEQHRAAYAAQDASKLEAVSEQLVTLADERMEADQITLRQRCEILAPFIRSWNIAHPEKDEPAPSPQAIGVDAFDVVSEQFVLWAYTALVGAYQKNGFWPTVIRAMTASSNASASPAEPTPKSDTTTPEPEPADSQSDHTPPSPKPSRGRSRSGPKT